MSSQKKARGLPGMKEGPLVQMLDRQRVQQAAADEAKKLVDAAVLVAERLVDATKEAEETETAAPATAALSPAEDLSEQRASASLPDSVPIESEEERAAREEDEMAALDAVGDYEADPTVMYCLQGSEGVVCMCCCVGVGVCVCVRARARRRVCS